MPSLRTPSSLVTRMLSIPGVYTVTTLVRGRHAHGAEGVPTCVSRAEALPHFSDAVLPPPTVRRKHAYNRSGSSSEGVLYDLVALAGVRAHADGARVGVGRRLLPDFLRPVGAADRHSSVDGTAGPGVGTVVPVHRTVGRTARPVSQSPPESAAATRGVGRP